MDMESKHFYLIKLRYNSIYFQNSSSFVSSLIETPERQRKVMLRLTMRSLALCSPGQNSRSVFIFAKRIDLESHEDLDIGEITEDHW